MAGAFVAGSIASKLVLDTKSWSDSVGKVEGDKTKMKRSAGEMSAKFKKVGLAMAVAGAAVIGALGKMVSKFKETGDWIDKMSKRTGVSATALSELAHAADISGASLAEVEKATRKMQMSIVDAGDGLTEYIRQFGRLGIDVEKLKQLKPEDQFTMIGEAIGNLKDPTDQAATAMKIFGRTGTALLPMFKEGKGGIRALREEAHTLGIVFDEEAAAGAAKLKDEQTRLGASVKGLGFSLASTLVPVLTELVPKITAAVVKFREWATANPALLGTIVKVVGALGGAMAVMIPIVMLAPKIIKGIKGIALAMKFLALHPAVLLIAALGAIVVGFLKVKAAQAEAEKASKRYAEVAGNFEKKLKGIATQAGLTAEQFDDLKKKYNGNINVMALAIKKGEEGLELQEAMNEVGKERVIQQDEERKAMEFTLPVLEDLALGYEDAGEKQKTWLDYMKDQGLMTLQEKGERVDELEGFLRDLEDAYDDGKISLEDFEAATKSAKEEVEELTTVLTTTLPGAARDMAGVIGEAMGGLKDNIEDLPEWSRTAKREALIEWKDLSDGIRTQWTNMWSELFTAKSWDDALSALEQFGKNVIQQVADIAAQAMAKWTLGFLSKMVLGTASMAKDVIGSVADVGKSALKVAAGFSPAGMISTTIGTAVGSFLGSLLGKKGPSANDTRLIKEYNFEAKQHLFNLAIIADAMKWSLWNSEEMMHHVRDNTDAMKEAIWGGNKILMNISSGVRGLVKAIKKAKGFAEGGVSTEPEIAFLHGSKADPEVILRSSQLEALGGSPGSREVNLTVNLNNAVLSRDFTRNDVIPEMIRALKSKLSLSEMQEALGIA